MKNQRSGKLPSYIRYEKEISLVAKIVYCELDSYVDVSPFFMLSMGRLADDLGLTTDQVKSALLELKEHNILLKQNDMFYLENRSNVSKDDLFLILNTWNQQGAITCTKITDELKIFIENKVKEFGLVEVLESIKRYGIALADEEYFFNHKYSLKSFVKQKNGVDDFLEDGVKWVNYQRTKSQTKKAPARPEDYLKERGYI